MKQLLSILLLLAITLPAYADKNAKPNKVKQPARYKQQPTVTFNTDTTSTPLPQQQGKASYWEYDSRMGRTMAVDPSPQQQSNPYQFTDNKPVKLNK